MGQLSSGINKSSKSNYLNLKDALMYLPDKAAAELSENDIDDYMVVRVADEILIDIMKSACGLTYGESKNHIIKVKLKDVEIPFPDTSLLYKTKLTLREKDRLDRLFLEEKLRKILKQD